MPGYISIMESVLVPRSYGKQCHEQRTIWPWNCRDKKVRPLRRNYWLQIGYWSELVSLPPPFTWPVADPFKLQERCVHGVTQSIQLSVQDCGTGYPLSFQEEEEWCPLSHDEVDWKSRQALDNRKKVSKYPPQVMDDIVHGYSLHLLSRHFPFVDFKNPQSHGEICHFSFEVIKIGPIPVSEWLADCPAEERETRRLIC